MPNSKRRAWARRQRRGYRGWLTVYLATACVGTTSAIGAMDPDAQFWDQPDLQEQVAAVSDGELRFVSERRARGVHSHRNWIRITEESLADGWVTLEQCHQDLDAVPAVQILFDPQGIRALRVLSAARIGQARVEGHSIQLRDVSPGASLCLRGESRALHDFGGGRYRLRNGPYMRRFLDGYYPMRVSLDIGYPVDRLRLASHSPAPQEGLRVTQEAGRVGLDAAFEGRLVTCFDFCTEEALDCAAPLTPCAADSP
jgi:hypothetical protein